MTNCESTSSIRHSSFRHSAIATIRSPFVTRSTSSIVVTPASTFNQASSRSVRMPSARAALRISQLLARSWASWRTASVVTHSSKMPCRPTKAKLPAAAAALRPIQRLAAVFELVPGKILGQVVALRLERLAALRAQRAHQPLGHHGFDRAGDQERLDAHIDQPRVGARRIVRVQRAEHQVAGERRLNRVLGRFHIANFADEHDVRVVTQNRPQRRGEREPDLRMDLNLVDAFELVFDRVFGRDDLRRFVLDLEQRAVERRRFAGAGRAR